MTHLQRMAMTCEACGRGFIGDLLMDVPVEHFVAHIRALLCPHCGAGPKKILLGAARKSSEAPDRSEGG